MACPSRIRELIRSGCPDPYFWACPRKKDQSAPDYTPLANASAETNKIMAELGQQQLDFAKQQYSDNLPLFKDLVAQQLAIGDQSQEQGDEYYGYLKDTFRPVEQGLVDDANTFSTDAYREQEASKAAADSGLAFSNTQESNARALTSMGVNPNSGRFSGTANRNALAGAAIRTGAMNGAREKAEAVGYAKRMDAAGLGRNLTGASQGAYGLALNAGNSAGANAQTPGAQYQAGMAAGAGTIGQGRQMYQGGLQGVLNAQTSVYNSQQESGLDVGGLLSGGAAIMKAWPSDRRLKENIEAVGTDERTGLTLYHFNYIGDDTVFRGVMADEVERIMPDAVMEDDLGYKAVNYDMLGIEFKGVAR